METAKEYVKNLVTSNSTYKSFKLFAFILIIVNLLLGISLFMQIKSDPMIIGVNEDGFPMPFETTDYRLQNLINHQQFTAYFLNRVYDWNSQTFESQVRSALPMMSNSIRSQFLSQIEDREYTRRINENNLTSAIHIPNINPEDIQAIEGGFLVTLEATRMRIENYIDESYQVEIRLGIQPTSVSQDNIWGFEVFELQERRL